MISDVKVSGESTCVAGLQNWKTLPISMMISFDNVHCEQWTVCSWSVFKSPYCYSGINVIFSCEVIKTENSDLWQRSARPLGRFAFIDLFTEAKLQLVQFYAP